MVSEAEHRGASRAENQGPVEPRDLGTLWAHWVSPSHTGTGGGGGWPATAQGSVDRPCPPPVVRSVMVWSCHGYTASQHKPQLNMRPVHLVPMRYTRGSGRTIGTTRGRGSRMTGAPHRGGTCPGSFDGPETGQLEARVL